MAVFALILSGEEWTVPILDVGAVFFVKDTSFMRKHSVRNDKSHCVK